MINKCTVHHELHAALLLLRTHLYKGKGLKSCPERTYCSNNTHLNYRLTFMDTSHCSKGVLVPVWSVDCIRVCISVE